MWYDDVSTLYRVLLPDTLGRQPSEQRHLGNGKMLLLGMMLDKRSIFFDGKLGRYPQIELDASAKPARRAHFEIGRAHV